MSAWKRNRVWSEMSRTSSLLLHIFPREKRVIVDEDLGNKRGERFVTRCVLREYGSIMSLFAVS